MFNAKKFFPFLILLSSSAGFANFGFWHFTNFSMKVFAYIDFEL